MTTFHRQALYIRPHHYETPHSYLDRLCDANAIHTPLVTAVVKKRRAETGHKHLLAHAIRDLAGVEPMHWVKAYTRAVNPIMDDANRMLGEVFRKPRDTRWVCTRCTGGQTAGTWEHHQFTICLRHGRWLAPGHGPEHQRQVPGEAVWLRAERAYRQVARSPFLTRPLVDEVWRIVRDQATVLGPPDLAARLAAAEKAQGFKEGVDDRLALYPETVRILAWLARAEVWDRLVGPHRNQERLRAGLRRGFDWMPGDKSVLEEALAEALIRSRRSRLTQLDEAIHAHIRKHGPTPRRIPAMRQVSTR